MKLIVSFPRSGQHLVEKILEFCCKEHNIEFTYCEFYNCCNSIPCKQNKMIGKNHDFDLTMELENDYKYISLYRKDVILQLEAYYRYWIKCNNYEYDYNSLLNFIKDNERYYKKFTKKWIKNKNKNILKLEYYEILNNPIKSSKKIFRHFFPEVKINNKIFDKLIDIELEVYTPGLEGIYYHKISLINKLDDELYKRIKQDLNLK